MSLARILWSVAFAATSLPAAAKAAFTSFDPPGSAATVATSINRSGTVAGYFVDQSSVSHGFVRSVNGSFILFDPPGSIGTQVFGLNDAGAAVGRFNDNAGIHCFLRDPEGAFTAFDAPPGGQQCTATGINTKGEIVGYEFESRNVAAAFLRTAKGTITAIKGVGGFSEATAINGAGVVAGLVTTNSQSPGFVRARNGDITTFDAQGDVNGTFSQSINAKGEIVGYFSDSSGADHSFLRAPGGAISVFDPPGAHVSEATGINAGGEITGFYDVGGFVGFVRSRAGEFQTIRAPGGSAGTFPHGINNQGAVTGYYLDAQYDQHGFIRTP